MKAESLEYQDGDVTLKGFVALDDQNNDKRPGILVMPEAFGLGKQAKGRAERLAGLGYAALAGDPYGNGLEVSDLQEAIKHAGAIRADTTKSGYRRALELEPSYGQVYTAIGEALLQTGEKAQAIRYLRQGTRVAAQPQPIAQALKKVLGFQ